MTDAIIARLRTLTPVAWGALISWLLTALPWLRTVLDRLGVDLNSAFVQYVVGIVVTAAFYELVRRVQPWLNAHAAWLARALAGSTAMPTYARLGTDGVPDVTSLPARPAEVDGPQHRA